MTNNHKDHLYFYITSSTYKNQPFLRTLDTNFNQSYTCLSKAEITSAQASNCFSDELFIIF